jgi:hypothetical protein
VDLETRWQFFAERRVDEVCVTDRPDGTGDDDRLEVVLG